MQLVELKEIPLRRNCAVVLRHQLSVEQSGAGARQLHLLIHAKVSFAPLVAAINLAWQVLRHAVCGASLDIGGRRRRVSFVGFSGFWWLVAFWPGGLLAWVAFVKRWWRWWRWRRWWLL